MGLELKKKVSGSFFFFLAFIAKPCLSYSQPLIGIIAISQDTLERRVGNCMESDNQRLRKATRVTSNLETKKTPGSTLTSKSLLFTKEQLNFLYKIIGKYEVSSSSTSCAFAQLGTFKTIFRQLGTFKTVFSIYTILHYKTWIIDLRVIDDMTKESNVFLSYIQCSSNQKL